MKSKLSIKDVTVIKANDAFSNDEMSKILGGNAEMGCVCRCGTNTASMAAEHIKHDKVERP
ncbi:MAG: hypothetical protein NC322_08085 [Alistipes senegalensis]|nr:hypothetical protein [Alistipes senegalensis]